MKYLIGSLLVLVLLICLALPLPAQVPPPMLPSAPEQAPLGGLGLLALAAGGGAYAWKKLRGREEG